MRSRRRALMISGCARSAGVIEPMIASVCLNTSSGMSMSLSALPMPGSIEAMSFRLPIFFTCWIWAMKSLKSNWFLTIFFFSLRASSSSNCSCARSTSDTTSPMPRMRSAMRSGWNTCRASIFSPLDMNFSGLSTTERIEIAAPPRVSPSSLVSTTPSKSSRSLNSLAVFTASWPVIASTTNSVSEGFTAALMAVISSIIASSTAKRPAVSTITALWPFCRACLMAFCAISTGFLLPSSV